MMRTSLRCDSLLIHAFSGSRRNYFFADNRSLVFALADGDAHGTSAAPVQISRHPPRIPGASRCDPRQQRTNDNLVRKPVGPLWQSIEHSSAYLSCFKNTAQPNNANTRPEHISQYELLQREFVLNEWFAEYGKESSRAAGGPPNFDNSKNVGKEVHFDASFLRARTALRRELPLRTTFIPHVSPFRKPFYVRAAAVAPVTGLPMTESM